MEKLDLSAIRTNYRELYPSTQNTEQQTKKNINNEQRGFKRLLGIFTKANESFQADNANRQQNLSDKICQKLQLSTKYQRANTVCGMHSTCKAGTTPRNYNKRSDGGGTQLTVGSHDEHQLAGVGFPRRTDEMNYLLYSFIITTAVIRVNYL